MLCLHQTKTAHPKMRNEQGRGDQAGSCLIPWRPHPALPFPDFLPLGSRAAEGQSSEWEETQTHGEVRREFTVVDSRLDSLGEQQKPSGFPPQVCPRQDPPVLASRNPSLCRLCSVAHVHGRAGARAGSTAHRLLRLPAGGRHAVPQPERLSASCRLSI